MAAGAFLTGIFLDLDHVLDGYLECGLKYNPFHTISRCQNGAIKKSYIFLHSYEVIAVYSAMVLILDKWGVWYGIAVGAAIHLILDRLINACYPNTYFLTYRYKQRFDFLKLINIQKHFAKYKKK